MLGDLIKGIEWLASERRNGAKAFAEAVDADEQLLYDLEEAVEWIKDVAEGKEI